MTQISRELTQEGYLVKKEDVAVLSPYLTHHIKRFGDYLINMEMVPAPLDREITFAFL